MFIMANPSPRKPGHIPCRALITGASSGIGRACARRFAAEGFEIGVLSEQPEHIRDTVQELMKTGACAFPVDVDLLKPEQVRGAIDRCEASFGPIDVLINSAGIGLQATALEIREQDMRNLFEVNYFAMVMLCNDAFRHMSARRSGHIINISSAAARRGLPGMATYASTKAAMHVFSQALRVEGMGCGVHVTEVLPMTVRTPFFEHAMNRSKGAYEGSSFSVTADRVAELVWRAYRRPVPEVYTSTLARIALAIDGAWPSLLDRIIARQRRK
jgi:short-subunit dehydrogenase